MTRREFGIICRKARLNEGMTQLQLAKKTGLHVNYYSRLERGEVNVSLERIIKLLTTLNIQITLP